MPDIDRRAVLRLGVLGLALGGSAVGTARLAAGASGPERPGTAGSGTAGSGTAGSGTASPGPLTDDAFDELYRGRRIRACLAAPGALSAMPARVYIDDVELHVMPGGDGRYTSVLNHYRSFRTLRQTARAAVDNLYGAALLPQPGPHLPGPHFP